MRRGINVWPVLLTAACGGAANTDPFGAESGDTTTSGTVTTTMGVDTSTGPVADTATGLEPPKLDLSQPDLEIDQPPPSCHVVDGMDAIGDCEVSAPPDSFEPEVQWSWNGGQVVVTPLVANLTDDNADDSIDLCDIPDIVIVAGAGFAGADRGRLGLPAARRVARHHRLTPTTRQLPNFFSSTRIT